LHETTQEKPIIRLLGTMLEEYMLVVGTEKFLKYLSIIYYKN